MALSPKTERRIARFISLLLRHRPEELGLSMDAAGWVSAEALLEGLRAQVDIEMADIEAIVANDEKGRFALADGMIRANQGHSLPVDLGLEPTMPDGPLFHGTVARFLDAIMSDGLRPQGRQHVHLSPDIPTARMVGSRRGSPVVLIVDAPALSRMGHVFYLSANGVWLTDHVPAQALSFAEVRP